MSKPGSSKQKDVKTKQTVMGDYFSKPNKSKKPTKRENSTENKETKRGSLKRKVTGAGMFGFSWTRGAQRDTEEYRNGYPGKKDHPELKDNYMFYMNKIPSKPDGDYIDNIHANWWGDYKLLEVHHGYIQWLFPIRESGLNWHAQELQLHEIKKLTKNKEAMERILISYKMMLDFYGMEILNEEDGDLCRAENWKERFQHLNRSYHNYLRITRILKCLGEFGYEHLKKNFVKFVLEEGLKDGTLSNLIDSCVKYWIGVLREDDDREEMFDLYEKLSEDDRALAKRRNRSVSPPVISQKKTDTGSSKQTITKPKNENSKEKKEKDSVKDESDEEDGTLYYAMSLIEDKDEQQLTENKTSRKDHDMSESDEENVEDESQEMNYWNKETTANGSEVDTNKENENVNSDKKASGSKIDNRANEHELENGSDACESSCQEDTSEGNKSTDSSKNNIKETGGTIAEGVKGTGEAIAEGVEETGDTIAEGMETGEEIIQNNVQSKDMDTDNVENDEMQVADTNEDVSDKKVHNIDKPQTRARTTEAEQGNDHDDVKTGNNTNPDEPNKVTEDNTKADGTEVMETA